MSLTPKFWSSSLLLLLFVSDCNYLHNMFTWNWSVCLKLGICVHRCTDRHIMTVSLLYFFSVRKFQYKLNALSFLLISRQTVTSVTTLLWVYVFCAGLSYCSIFSRLCVQCQIALPSASKCTDSVHHSPWPLCTVERTVTSKRPAPHINLSSPLPVVFHTRQNRNEYKETTKDLKALPPKAVFH